MLRIIYASQISSEVFKTIKYNSKDQIKKAEEDKNKYSSKGFLNRNAYLYEMTTHDNNIWFEKKMENEKLINTPTAKFNRSLHQLVKEKVNEE